MFKENPIVGVLLALGIIVLVNWAVVYHTSKLIAQERVLFMFIMLTSMMSSVWLVDNVIAFHNTLLSEKEDDAILKVMTSIIQLTLGYYIGVKTTNKDSL